MSNFAPRLVSTPHHFEIVEDSRGYWVAQDRAGLIGGVFRSRKDALHFALYEVAGDSARVQVIPQAAARPGQSSPLARFFTRLLRCGHVFHLENLLRDRPL
jgi:hypothetical protein